MGAVDMKLFISADDDVDPTLRLVDVGIKDNSLLKCEDFTQDFTVMITVKHYSKFDENQYEIQAKAEDENKIQEKAEEEKMEIDYKNRKRSAPVPIDEEVLNEDIKRSRIEV
uniref:Uncharacterized protein n=1 Tax=Panagrolaimus sp. JU765 TaxID=591449 RepID=A0AC34QPR2_9BILA